MSIKTKAAIAMTVMSSWLSPSKADAQNPNNNKKTVKTEQTASVAREAEVKYHAADTVADYVVYQQKLSKDKKANIAAQEMLNKIGPDVSDSLLEARRTRLNEAKELMLYVIAHFEGVRSNAYWDKAAKIWTYNLGNTIQPNGKPVGPNTKVKTPEESLEAFDAHVEKAMTDDMVHYLPMEKMEINEIALMGSMFYNCGTGTLKNKKTGEPSDFAKASYAFYTTHTAASSKEFDKQFLNYCHVKGQVNKVLQERRTNELAMIHNEIKITVDDNIESDEHIVNLKKATLGAFYGCNGDPEKIASRFSIDSRYYCPTDSLHVAIKQQLAQQQSYTLKRNTKPRSTSVKTRVASRGRGR